MIYDKIKWCLQQKKGIKIIEPNENLSKRYIDEALSDLETIEKVNEKWKVITSYYSCYNALYSVLMKAGVKCEIHDCTIALMDFLGFSSLDTEFMYLLKEKRINVQYYLKSSDLFIDKKKVSDFVIKCKKILSLLDDNKINEIRSKLIK